ncbi:MULTISPECIES: hypothetical protein [unclassified Pseudomonas]|jgi:hypothetical protein|uniref:hypothetical protein n=1 Tax=unclassified Pseudomonas TaxID=196821 RepID=UPI002A36D3B2|nr:MULTISPECIES: hypothetical protein [unclassified Pseudomonas]MDX9670556.1 hypothetical protein [Pseudomonas sp. P8_250]WPN35443.1 hypothetical protein QMK53_25100 [Pseudomonas sp. P8_139]WPN42755.1 hypothetical protein QMK55_06275 [Pseudomonas sp. P8_229]
MRTDTFEGHCTGKSMQDGEPAGSDFVATRVFFFDDIFAGQKPATGEFIQIYYGEALTPSPKPYELDVKNEVGSLIRLEYKSKDSSRIFYAEGKLTVTISENSQKGTFDGTYFNESGKLTKFEVDFSAEESVNR